MKVNTKELRQALEFVRPGLAKKEMIAQSTSFAFVAGRVITYNDEISISHPIPLEAVVGATDAESLYKFLSRVTTEEIDVKSTDTEILISAGKAKVGILLEREIRLPLTITEVEQQATWKTLPEKFLHALRFVLFSCATNMSLPALMCVHVREDGIIESCDNFRLTQYKVEGNIPHFLLPFSTVQELVKFDITEYYHNPTSPGWVNFKTSQGTIFSSRVYEETFPDTTPIVQEGEPIAIEFPSAIEAVLARGEVFTNERNLETREMKVTIGAGVLTIQARNETGWLNESAHIRYRGATIAFNISPKLLRDMVCEDRCCTVDMKKRQIRFTGNEWLHIITLSVDGG